MERARVLMHVTVKEPGGKTPAKRMRVLADAVIFGGDVLKLRLGGESMDALDADRQGVGDVVAVYPMSWVLAIDVELPKAT